MDFLEEFDIFQINYWVLIPVTGIIVFLAILESRDSRAGTGRRQPVLVIPFRFLDGYENRTAYAMAFGTTTSRVVSLITSQKTLGFDLPLWAAALTVYLQAIVGCLTCFPLFACLTTPYRAVGAILCILYSLLWLNLEVLQVTKYVATNSSSTGIIQISDNETLGVYADKVYYILQSLPVICCYLVLVIYCIYILHRCYTSKIYFQKAMQGKIKPHQEEHVRWIFRNYTLKSETSECKPTCYTEETFVSRLKDSVRLRYFTNFPFFKYPARMFAVCFVLLNISYWAALLLMRTTVTLLFELLNLEIAKQIEYQYGIEITGIVFACSIIALIVCFINGLIEIFTLARNYRLDMLRVYQGDKSFIPVLDKTPQNILTRSMTFPGYQVGFMLWGIILCFVTVMLLTLIPSVLLYIADKLDIIDSVFLSLAQLLGFPATVLVLFYLQVLMTRHVLLQDKIKTTDESAPLNVDNRNFYEIVNYYSLFTNMAVGVATCLFRIMLSALFGIFSIARLDRSVFPHDLESWDRGYAAYVSMLLVDNAHNNPCMRVFAHLLWTRTLAARLEGKRTNKESTDSTGLVSSPVSSYLSPATDIGTPTSAHSVDPWTFLDNPIGLKRLSQRAQQRWCVAYTLLRNPQLAKFRKMKMAGIDRKLSTVQEKTDDSLLLDI